MFATFLLVYLSLKESFYKTRKNAFYFTSNLKIRILRHRMTKHKTRNTFYWITWEENTACLWTLASLYHIKKKILSKNTTKTATWKLVPGLFGVCKELNTTCTGKWNFWSKLLILDMWYQNYQNLCKSAYRPPQFHF